VVDKVVTFGLPSPPVNQCHCRLNKSLHAQGWCPSAKNLNYMRFNSQQACIRLVKTKVKHQTCKKSSTLTQQRQIPERAKGAWKPPWPPPLPVQFFVHTKELPGYSPIHIHLRHQRRNDPKDTEDSGDRLSIYHQVSLLKKLDSNKTDCRFCTPEMIVLWKVEKARTAAGQWPHGWHLLITGGRARSFRQKVSIPEKSEHNGIEEVQGAAILIRVATLALAEETTPKVPCSLRAFWWQLKAKSIPLLASCQNIQDKTQKDGFSKDDSGRLTGHASKGPQDGFSCLQEDRKNVLGSLQTLNESILPWQKSNIRFRWLCTRNNGLLLHSFCRSATGSPLLPTINNERRVVKLRPEAQTLRMRADPHIVPTWQAPINRIRSTTSDLHVSLCRPIGPQQSDQNVIARICELVSWEPKTQIVDLSATHAMWTTMSASPCIISFTLFAILLLHFIANTRNHVDDLTEVAKVHISMSPCRAQRRIQHHITSS
jgi:hypothetical protein